MQIALLEQTPAKKSKKGIIYQIMDDKTKIKRSLERRRKIQEALEEYDHTLEKYPVFEEFEEIYKEIEKLKKEFKI
jgi:ATPase subunit of ABC transporter with duplicated ATPase domains